MKAIKILLSFVLLAQFSARAESDLPQDADLTDCDAASTLADVTLLRSGLDPVPLIMSVAVEKYFRARTAIEDSHLDFEWPKSLNLAAAAYEQNFMIHLWLYTESRSPAYRFKVLDHIRKTLNKNRAAAPGWLPELGQAKSSHGQINDERIHQWLESLSGVLGSQEEMIVALQLREARLFLKQAIAEAELDKAADELANGEVGYPIEPMFEINPSNGVILAFFQQQGEFSDLDDLSQLAKLSCTWTLHLAEITIQVLSGAPLNHGQAYTTLESPLLSDFRASRMSSPTDNALRSHTFRSLSAKHRIDFVLVAEVEALAEVLDKNNFPLTALWLAATYSPVEARKTTLSSEFLIKYRQISLENFRRHLHDEEISERVQSLLFLDRFGTVANAWELKKILGPIHLSVVEGNLLQKFLKRVGVAGSL